VGVVVIGKPQACRAVAVGVLAASTLIAGCGLFDSGVRWQDGRFMVVWIDTPSSAHLAYKIEGETSMRVVDACVFAVASNERYITLERAATSDMRYFVVDKLAYLPERERAKEVQGPMSKRAFDALRERLPLPLPQEVMPASMCNPA
jgi:hypothetical protein